MILDPAKERELSKKYPTYPLGRNVNSVHLYTSNLNPHQFDDVLILEQFIDNNFVSGGICANDDTKLVTFFPDLNTDTYIARYIPQGLIAATGFGCQVFLTNWKDIKYFAIGFNVQGTYHHIKIVHPTQDKETVLFFSLADLVYLIQNKWQHLDDVQVDDVRFFIKGTGGSGGGKFELSELCIFREARQDFNLNIKKNDVSFSNITGNWQDNFSFSSELAAIIYDYQSAVCPAEEKHVDSFMDGNGVGVQKTMTIDWNIFSQQPERLSESITYRYAWHSLYPVCILLIKANQTNAVNYICAARDFINNWLDANLFRPSRDMKYAWYDHGAAERLIVLVQMWYLGVKHKFDARFMSRLLYAIYVHAQLMASAAFYASHQNYKYHNHAIFQDLSLIVVSLAIPEFKPSSYWFSVAIERLEEQIDNLIVTDDGFAVFVENSTGYHNGILTIMGLISKLMKYANISDKQIRLYEKMVNFTKMIRYPGSKRMPSIGDTVRKPNTINIKKSIKSEKEKSFYFLKNAGYAIAKGLHENIPFQLTMTATSLNKTHKHCDNLSFTLFFDNIEWLIDPSFYSYQYNEALPSYLRGPAAHNAIFIEGVNYSIEPGLAEMFSPKNADSNYFKINGVHHSYEDIQINRTVKGMLDTLNVKFIDKINSENNVRNIYLILHCGEHVDVDLSGKILTLTSKLSEYKLQIELPSKECQIFCGEKTDELIYGWTGMGFQEISPITTVRCEIPSNVDLDWCIVAQKT